MIGRLLTPKETAELLRCTEGELASWRREGTGPKYFRLGYRTLRYSVQQVEAWLRTQEAKR